jgi:hypothetical protein
LLVALEDDLRELGVRLPLVYDQKPPVLWSRPRASRVRLLLSCASLVARAVAFVLRLLWLLIGATLRLVHVVRRICP